MAQLSCNAFTERQWHCNYFLKLNRHLGKIRVHEQSSQDKTSLGLLSEKTALFLPNRFSGNVKAANRINRIQNEIK